MNEIVLVDTSAWFAGIARNDQYHCRAEMSRDQLQAVGVRFLTTNLIIHETTMLLERKVSKRDAVRFLKAILGDSHVEIVHVDEDVESAAFQLYQKYKDQDFSIVDCTSFVVMRKYRIPRCFTFDHHFLTMGFRVEPH